MPRLIAMLDFRRKRRRTATGHTVALERRLLLLLLGAGLVVMLMVGGGDTRNWRWLTPTATEPETPRQAPAAADHVVIGPTDTTTRLAAAVPNVASSEERPATYFPGVRTDYLSEVRDDTVFRPVESDGWFHLLAILQRTPNAEIVSESEGPVTCFQLSQQPNEYRGRLVTISGIARAAKRVAAPKNAFAIDGYFQLWVQPDRRSNELIALYCLELPEGFPQGEQIEATCSATGFFFKRWAYESRGGIATAPLIVAKTVAWQPPAVQVPQPVQPVGEQLLTAITLALVLAALAIAWIARRSWAAPGRGMSGDDNSGSDRTGQVDDTHVATALAALETQPVDGGKAE